MNERVVGRRIGRAAFPQSIAQVARHALLSILQTAIALLSFARLAAEGDRSTDGAQSQTLSATSAAAGAMMYSERVRALSTDTCRSCHSGWAVAAKVPHYGAA
jgi:hypothetical protein